LYQAWVGAVEVDMGKAVSIGADRLALEPGRPGTKND
jgi:hypothetical protein